MNAPGTRLAQVLNSYAQSIKLGYRHIYKSLPRLLTLWYDVGAQIGTQGPSASVTKVPFFPVPWRHKH